ncbi:hypothetical protein FRC00_007981 [Tulasnella sp. 408]|nr:hypothetical protein FRC00_007981 [Tulasnella sp. 408]
MTSIHSLPPELLRLIFHWATYDYAFFAKFPSWKRYSLYHLDGGEDRWPFDYRDMERERTAKALRLTCTRWTALATEFELYYIIIYDVPTLNYHLGRIRKFLEKDGEGENNVKCPVRILNLRMLKGSGCVWTEEDTEMVVSLIRDCPNLEFMVNGCYTKDAQPMRLTMVAETHPAGPIILQSLVNSCPKLKRLHWKPKDIMQVLPSSWSSILASSSLARSSKVLEIMSSSSAVADDPPPTPAPQLELPSLHCLQVSVDDVNSSLAAVIAKQWQLPSLTSLYLQSTYNSTFTPQNNLGIPPCPSAISLIERHGQSVTTLAISRRTACYIPLHILPPAPIQELVYYMYGLEKSTSVRIPFTALSTLVLLMDMDRDCPLTKVIWRALEQLRKLQDSSLPKLEKVVILSWPLDELKEPHPIDIRLLDETDRLFVDPWQQETPRLVNRNGVRLFTLVETDQS